MSTQAPYGHHAEIHQQLGRRPCPRALACEDVNQAVLRQDQPAGIQEEEQRLPQGPFDHLVENAVDLTAMSVRPHALGLVVLDHLVQAVEGLGLRLREEALQREPVAAAQVRSDSQRNLRGCRVAVLVAALPRVPVEVDNAPVVGLLASHPTELRQVPPEQLMFENTGQRLIRPVPPPVPDDIPPPGLRYSSGHTW